MSPPPEFAVVICHGPYLSSASYSPLIDALESKKIEAYCPQLATNDSSRHNLGNLDTPDYDREPPQKGYPQVDEDVEIILTVLRDLIKDQGKRVLLICHSTGSFSGLEAAQQELQEKVRMVDGLPGGIFGILHIGGFLVTVGHSINSAYQRGKMEWPPKLPPFFQYHLHGFAGLATANEPLKWIFTGMDPAEAQKWIYTLTAFPMMLTRLTNDSCSVIPWGYVFLENDMTLGKDYQGSMVAAQAQETAPLAMYRCSAGFSVHLSCPERLVDIVQSFAVKVERADFASGDDDSGVEII